MSTKGERRALRKANQKKMRTVNRRTKNKVKRLQAQSERKESLARMTDTERQEFILKERRAAACQKTKEAELLADAKANGKLNISVALAFSSDMNETEHTSLAQQIQRIWNTIRADLTKSVRFTLCNWEGQSFFAHCCEQFGFKNWIINFSPLGPPATYPSLRCIVLSPDSEIPLSEELICSDNVLFVIGGLVDRTVKKNKTVELANSLMVESRRIPIRELNAGLHPILNVNTVFEILHDVKFGDLSLQDAILKRIPGRKIYIDQRLGRSERRKLSVRSVLEGKPEN